MLENFDPNTIADESVRQVVFYLMNLVEKLSAKVQEQAEEIERLGEENNRLKGEQGKPKIKANKSARELSSEKRTRSSSVGSSTTMVRPSARSESRARWRRRRYACRVVARLAATSSSSAPGGAWSG